MIIIQLSGGLGNQMFQYAYGLYIENLTGYEVKFDETLINQDLKRNLELIDFELKLPIANNEEIKKIIGNRNLFRFKKRFSIYSKRLLLETEDKEITDNQYHIGYWQKEKYSVNQRNKIISCFKIDESNIDSTKLDIIKKSNSISIHVRRGDYVLDKEINNLIGNCSINYYLNAIEYFEEIFEDSRFFVFSDDISWCKENLKILNAHYMERSSSSHDLFLMSLCDHNIISNSSYSWWAAWLNQNEEKICIAPNPWYNNKSLSNEGLIPKNWKVLNK